MRKGQLGGARGIQEGLGCARGARGSLLWLLASSKKDASHANSRGDRLLCPDRPASHYLDGLMDISILFLFINLLCVSS